MIKSFLIRQAGSCHLLYDTVFNRKHVLTACGVGRMVGDDAELTALANDCLADLIGYAEDAHGAARVVLQPVEALAEVAVTVCQALEEADDQQCLFFVCGSAAIYDAVVVQLAVHWAPPGSLQ